MNIYSIYRATNIINGKTYIGYTKNFAERISSHKHNHQRVDNKFYNAIKKYGWSAFTWEIIYQSLDEDYCLNVIEPLLIKEHDSIKNGYNTTLGGNRGPIFFGSKNGMFGRTHSDAVKCLIGQKTKDNLKGKTYEEIHGIEKAKQIKIDRSKKTIDYLAKNPTARLGNKNPRARTYKLTDPNGTIHIVEGSIKTFCKIHKIDVGSIISVAKRRILSYKNWQVEYI